MEEWKEYKLGELCDILDSKRIPLSSSQREKRKGSYPYYGAQGIIDYIDDYIFDGTYLLVAEDGENLKSRKQDIAQIVSGKYWVNNHAHILGENGTCDIKLLCYVLNKTDISGYITGSAQPKLNQANLQAIKIKLPSLQTQQKITKILSSLDDKIEVNRRINEQLEELAQALFKSWFVDFEPFKDGEFVESELGMIPEGWKVGTFSDVVDSTLGGDWGKETEQGNYIKEVFCIRGADIPEIKNGNRGKMPIRFILQKNYEKKSLNNNDLVVEISGGSPTQSTGRICRVTSELLEKYNNSLICTNFCRAIKPLAKYSAYIYYYWQYLYDKGAMFNYENGTIGIKNLMINDILEKEPIIIPSIGVVEQYNNVVETFAIKIQKNGEEIEKLSNLRDTLLPKLMSGEIDVNEVTI